MAVTLVWDGTSGLLYVRTECTVVCGRSGRPRTNGWRKKERKLALPGAERPLWAGAERQKMVETENSVPLLYCRYRYSTSTVYYRLNM